MKRILALAAAVGLAAGLTACSDPVSGGAGGSDDGTKTIGVVALVATDALNAAVIRGVTEVAEDNGWKVHVTDTNGSVEAANAAMITYSTTQKMDAIAVMAFQTSALQAGLQSAQGAGIPVVSWGGELGAAIVATTSARAVGQDSIDALLEDFGDTGSVLALTYHTGVLCLYRGYAFDDTVAPITSLKVTRNEVAIPGQIDDGTRFTSAWLASNPEGSGPLAVWGSWDEPAIGAVAALQQSGRDDVWVYAINGGPQALQAVKDGTIRQVVWQDGETEGAEMMRAAVDYLEAPEGWVQKTVDVPGVVVTAETIDQFLTDHPDALNP
jgi:ribose transport system substrate-binding protein